MTLQIIKRIGEFDCNIYQLNKMCDKVNQTPWNVYQIIEEYGSFADSYTRECIFNYIADKYHNGDYEKVYRKWLDGNKFIKAYQAGMITKQEFVTWITN